jgi:hypothetical protein
LEILDKLFDLRIDNDRDIKVRFLLPLTSGEDLQIEIVIRFVADGEFKPPHGWPIQRQDRRKCRDFNSRRSGLAGKEFFQFGLGKEGRLPFIGGKEIRAVFFGKGTDVG